MSNLIVNFSLDGSLAAQFLVNKSLIKELKKAESTKLRYEAFANRVKCPTLNSLRQERKVCLKCQDQDQKKYKSSVENPLQHVCLVSKEGNPEIYLLTKEDVCWYNKKDLVSFLESGSKTKNLLKDKERKITDIKLYSV